MSAYFSIYGDDEDKVLKSFGATFKGSKATIRVEIEVADPRAAGWIIQELAQIERDHKAKATAKPKAQVAKPSAIATKKQLALPSPSDFMGGNGHER